MKKIIGTLLTISCVGLALAGCGSQNAAQDQANSSTNSGEKQKLVISTWGFSEDFFRKEIYEPFEKEHNVEIVMEIGNNGERLNKIRQGSSEVDLVYLSDYYAQQGINDGLFEKIDRSKIPNLDQIYDIAKAPLGEDYGPAYTVGQFGIAYNPNLIKTEIKSWKDLWSPELAGKLTLPNITSTTGPMILDAASQVAGSAEFNEDQAFAKLKELAPNVVKYYDKTSEYVNMFGQEEIAAGPIMEMYFKDIKAAVPEAKFVTPEEGGYAVMNTVNIVKGSKHKELAEEFINYQLSKEVQEKTAKAKVDSPVNKEVQLTPEEAEGVTFGDEINNLKKLDMKMVNEQQKQWVDRWNKELTQ
ncbi:ABC transporter substrate-binding protein [Brevibacillus fulvus]|uniref:Spermidine/putrescine transport system substrate-binding protein n=1 Tax=Brevibacillus fulvus TaxID=1125967 RepID=A0A938XTR2_9BACL|nr:ABC transporter substrate-binding protein [Brevibacillus fulvus]MBM7590318.1 putative spermidine/putrescine transport system substrate-binding protein [Brevibacillus fulvus]